MTAQDLKNSILQQAIQGKLLPQNPNDEPASELLKKISVERQKLIDEGKIKKEKPLPPISAEEIPFDIPKNWQWAYIGDVCINIQYGTSKKSESSGKIPVLRMGNIQDGRINYDNLVYTSDESDIARFNLEKNDLLFNRTNSRELVGKTAIYKAEFPAIYAGYLIRITPLKIDGDYLNLVMQSQYFWEYCRKVKYDAIGQSNINSQKLKNFSFPLPPLAEQKGIVAKLKEILPLIERYGELEQRLTKLDKEFPDKLKKSLLQQAIQGKLTRQLSTDGNAKDLLEKIRAEKLKFIEEGKIKKEKPLPPISAEEIPFDIPENWQWVRLGEICTKLVDGTHKTPHYTESGVKFLSVKNMSTGKIDFSFTKFISTEEHEILYKRCDPKKGDMLLSKVGTTGVPAYVDTDEQFSLFVSIALLRFNHDFIVPQILYNWIYSPLVQRQAAENTKGIGNKNWVLDKIATTFFPLPPLAEQKRIVKRLEKLLPLCDRLREKFLNVQ